MFRKLVDRHPILIRAIVTIAGLTMLLLAGGMPRGFGI